MRREIPVLLAAMLFTGGCSSMLTRDYVSVEPHAAAVVSEGDSNTIRAENYQELVNALIYLIDRGEESGAIRFDGTESDVKSLLDEACLEVVQEDPLGAYAVEFIKYSVTPIVGSYEADVQITYRRTREQIASVVDATGASAIRSELSEALADFSPEVVLRISYFEENEDYIRQLVREAYFSDPASALDVPDAEIFMYPESGQQRIVEVLLTYHESRQTLESRKNSLQREAARLSIQASAQTADGLAQVVQQAAAFDPEGGGTAYDALLGEGANDQGIALAYALVCQEAELSCTTVEGTREGTAHFWNVVQTSAGQRHIDLSLGSDRVFRTDEEMQAAGYAWSEDMGNL